MMELFSKNIKTILVIFAKKLLLQMFCRVLNTQVQSYKLYNNKYMIASTQITNTEIFAFIAVLVFKLLSRKVLLKNRKDNRKLLNSRLPFNKIANFTGKQLRNYKYLEREIFRILL